MERRFFIIDAFTDQRFAGNAAAVVLDAEGLDDRLMQAVAAEFNLSETTFILPPSPPGDADASKGGARAARACGAIDSSIRFRWFTPTVEATMCGHATIAGVHAMIESQMTPPAAFDNEGAPLLIQTRAGVLTAFVESMPAGNGRAIWLELIPPTLTPLQRSLGKLVEYLKLSNDVFEPAVPPTQTQDRDAIVFVKDVFALNSAKPDFALLGQWLGQRVLRGLCLATTATLTPAVSVQSRFFGPPVGIDEDPVTGSVHGPLAVLLVKHGLVPMHDGSAGMMCLQGKAGGRAGVVWALVRCRANHEYSVRIGGQTVTTMRGTLTI